MAFGFGSFRNKIRGKVHGAAKKHWENVGLRKRKRKLRDQAINNTEQGFTKMEQIRQKEADQLVRRFGR